MAVEPPAHRASGPPTLPVFAEQRQARILNELTARGSVRTSDLAEILHVSEPTIRKDIVDLAQQHLLRRTHGGAVALRPAYEPDLLTRSGRNQDAKRAIARACLALVADGDAIFLDGGTTIQALADLIAGGSAEHGPAPRNLNVLTNAIGVAQVLAGHSHVRHTVTGGTLRPIGGCFVGPLTLRDLTAFTVNIAFIGVTGLSDQGFTVADLSEAQVKTAVVERARHVVVAMDQTKIGATDFTTVCDLSAVNTVVTDAATEHLRRQCITHDVRLIEAA